MKIVGTHDGQGASVSILQNGKFIAVYEEERFSRIGVILTFRLRPPLS